jgi:hypothetical protein
MYAWLMMSARIRGRKEHKLKFAWTEYEILVCKLSVVTQPVQVLIISSDDELAH